MYTWPCVRTVGARFMLWQNVPINRYGRVQPSPQFRTHGRPSRQCTQMAHFLWWDVTPNPPVVAQSTRRLRFFALRLSPCCRASTPCPPAPSPARCRMADKGKTDRKSGESLPRRLGSRLRIFPADCAATAAARVTQRSHHCPSFFLSHPRQPTSRRRAACLEPPPCCSV